MAKEATALQELNPRRYRPYPEYKDSGVEWLSLIPRHWEVKPLKYIMDFINGFAFKPDEWGAEGTPIIRIENLNGGDEFNCTTRELPAKYWASKGDLLFGWSGNRGTSFGPFLWWRAGRHYVNQHIFRVANYGVKKRWLYWVLRAVTYYVEKQAHGIIGMVHVTRDELGSIPVPVLPPDEQQQIAELIDDETAKIDTLVAKKEQLIKLLQEKRTALITQAVTKGLDPNAPMKNSGVEWLGEIPTHWEVKRLRNVGTVTIGLTYEPSDVVSSQDAGILVLRASNVQNGRVELEDNVYVRKAIPIKLLTRRGDILICSRSGSRELIGKCAKIEDTTAGLTFGTFMTVFRSTFNEFLYFVFNSTIFRYQSGVFLTSTINQLTVSSLSNLVVAIPPVEEQHKVAAFLEREAAKIDALVGKVRVAIDRLKEYRAALISAAVTGKIDVRGEVS